MNAVLTLGETGMALSAITTGIVAGVSGVSVVGPGSVAAAGSGSVAVSIGFVVYSAARVDSLAVSGNGVLVRAIRVGSPSDVMELGIPQANIKKTRIIGMNQ
jgi:hypothetical protein